jgi:DNA polymerase-3 subunit gamma/tau
VSTALYRRYRPETYGDIIGQDHVTGPLMQALRTGRVGHAYLFSGPRGCGKTTSARILARCLNCEQGPTAEPCGECDSCVALARGGAGTVDVIEIDAASHGGVDDARDLRERASYGPAQSRYKVYIIDEAHMVTPQGFNALLKIVEEPPEHVKFVFATTEPDKVIGTIRSRTHHYPFRLVPPQLLSDYLGEICTQEGVSVAPGVLSFVVRSGGGSVRDSLSVLDQLIAGSGPEGLTYESAAALLGFTDGELLDAAIDAFAAADAAGAFRAIEKVIESGLDPRRFVEDLLERLRDLIVVAAVPDGASAVLRALPEDQLDRMRHQAAAFGPGALSRAADIVNAGLTEMTGATAPRLQLELIAARILLPAAAGEAGYAARLDRLERRLDVGGVPTAAGPAPSAPAAQPVAPARQAAPQRAAPQQAAPQQAAPQQPSPPASAPQRSAPARVVPEPPPPSMPEASAPEPQAAPADRGEPLPAASRTPGGIDTAAIRRSWPDVLAKIFALKRATWTFLSEHAQVVDYDGERLLLGISTVGLANTFRRGQHAEYVRQALIDVLGLDVLVEGVPTDEAQASAGGTGTSAGAPERPAPRDRHAARPAMAPATSSAGAGSFAGPPAARPGGAPADGGSPGDEPPPDDDPGPRVVDDTAASFDDEDIAELGEVGLPVVQRILGATVIDDGAS